MLKPTSVQVSLTTALLHISRRLIEIAQERDQALATAIRATDVRAAGSGVRDGQADASSGFGDLCTLLQRVVDAFDAILLELHQEAGGHLWLWRTRIEERRAGVREELPGHQVVSLQHC